MRRAGQQGRQGRADRRGGTSRTGAKRAGECDGLTGLPEAIEATWPQATVQTCVVHLIRASMRFVSYGDRRKVAAALKAVYTAPNQEAAWQALTDFSESDMGVKYPQTVTTWERAWERFTPFLDFPPMLRRVISPPLRGRYPLHQQHRDCELPAAQGSPMNRGHFPSDEAVIKLPKAGDLRHLWTNEPENATRRKDCQHPSAGPRASSSKGRSPPTGTRPWPSSPPPTPIESTPTYRPRLHRKLDRPSWIELRYNHVRLHSALGYRTPNEVEQEFLGLTKAA